MAITLKAARVNVGLTIAEAARELGVSRQTLSSWENGKTMPHILLIPKIEQLYRTQYDDLIFFKQ